MARHLEDLRGPDFDNVVWFDADVTGCLVRHCDDGRVAFIATREEVLKLRGRYALSVLARTVAEAVTSYLGQGFAEGNQV